MVMFGHLAHQPLQRQRMIAGLQHVVGVIQVYFELAGEASATAPSAGSPCICASVSMSLSTPAKWLRLSSE